MIRWSIALIAVIFAVFAMLSDTRREKLARWLSEAPLVLTETQRAEFEGWLHTHLVDTDVIDAVTLNPRHMVDGLKLIVHNSDIPGVAIAIPLNAAYDPALDTLFLDSRFALEAIEPVSTRESAGFSGTDLLLFTLLHELGHRAMSHKGVSHLWNTNGAEIQHSDPSSKEAISVPSKQQELEADRYALEELRRVLTITLGDGALDDETLVRRVASFIEETLLGSFLVGNLLPLDTVSFTHPTLLERTRGLLLALLSRADLPTALAGDARAYIAWIDTVIAETRTTLADEVIAPTGTHFALGTSTPWGGAFLLTDGRIALVRAGQLDERHVAPKASGHSIEIVGAPFDSPPSISAELTSGSSLWFDDDGLYLLRPTGGRRLFFAGSSTGWKWLEIAALLPDVPGAIVQSHRPTTTSCPTLAFAGLGAFYIFLLHRGTSYHAEEVLQLEEPPSDSPNYFRYEYAGASRDAILIRQYFPASGVSYFMSVSVACLGAKPWRPTFLNIPALEKTAISGVALSPSGKTIYAVLSNQPWARVPILAAEPGRPIERYEFVTFLDVLSSDVLEVAAFSNFGGGGVMNMSLLRDGRYLAINLWQMGFFVYDLQQRRLIFQGVGARRSFFGVQLGSSPMIATPAAEGSRILLWHIF